MNGNKKNENITAVDRRRQGRKRAVGVAFSALAGALLTILSPGLTSSASALTNAGTWDSPGDYKFKEDPLTAELVTTPDGNAVGILRTGKVVVEGDPQGTPGQNITTTYTLQAWPLGASAWQDAESKTVVTYVYGDEENVVPRVAFSPRKGGTPERYRLVVNAVWTSAYNGEQESRTHLYTSNQGDYACAAPRLVRHGKAINCGVIPVGNSYSIALS